MITFVSVSILLASMHDFIQQINLNKRHFRASFYWLTVKEVCIIKGIYTMYQESGV